MTAADVGSLNTFTTQTWEAEVESGPIIMLTKFSARLAALAAVVLASIAIAWIPAYRFFWFAYRTGDESYILLVPLICAGLIYLDQKRVFAAAKAGMNPWAASCMAAGAVAIVVAYLTGGDLQLMATAFGLGALWASGFLALFGVSAGRAAMFPLLMLLWMVPIPSPVLDAIIVALQKGSADLTEMLFHAVNVPVLRNGMIFELPGVSIEVAKECSGIRSTLSLVLLMMIVVHESLESNWRRLFVMLLTIPIVVVKNGVRIVTLTLLSMYVDPSFLHGDLHNRGGIVFFLLGLAILLPLVGLLRRGELRKGRGGVPPATAAASATET